MIENPSGKRPLRRQSQRWTDTMKRDFTGINATFDIGMAANIEQWRGIVEAVKYVNGPFQ